MDDKFSDNQLKSAPGSQVSGAGKAATEPSRSRSLRGTAGSLDDSDTKDIDVYDAVLVTQRPRTGEEEQAWLLLKRLRGMWQVRLVAVAAVWLLGSSMLPRGVVPGESSRRGTVILTDLGLMVREQSYAGLRGADRPLGDVTVTLELGDGWWTASDRAFVDVPAGVLKEPAGNTSLADEEVALAKAVGRWIDTKTPEVRAEGWLKIGQVQRERRNWPILFRGVWLMGMAGLGAWLVVSARRRVH